LWKATKSNYSTTGTWKRKNDDVLVRENVPANSTATFIAPDGYIILTEKGNVDMLNLSSGCYQLNCIKNN